MDVIDDPCHKDSWILQAKGGDIVNDIYHYEVPNDFFKVI